MYNHCKTTNSVSCYIQCNPWPHFRRRHLIQNGHRLETNRIPHIAFLRQQSNLFRTDRNVQFPKKIKLDHSLLSLRTSLNRSSLRCCFFKSIFFTATWRFVLLSRARQTTPVEPSPILIKLSRYSGGPVEVTTTSSAFRNCSWLTGESEYMSLVLEELRRSSPLFSPESVLAEP